MKLGLIGYPLGHSWSPQIHNFLIHEDYQKFELNAEELDAFLKARDFDGLNVTIPYKQTVIPYLDEIDPAAKAIGAVNCIVNRDGKLKGYNTDYDGFKAMLVHNGIETKGRKTAVLGSGGASKAVVQALRDLGADVTVVSRRTSENTITYEDLYASEAEWQLVVNATPVGMYPNTDAVPLDLSRFTGLESVVDIIANPIRTKLSFEAKAKGLKTCGGFEMLVRQAWSADEYFLDREMDPALVEACMNHLLFDRRNLVLIGMPTSGKSTVAKILGEKLNRRPVEMDEEIEHVLGTSIKECFADKGEAYFRSIECDVAKANRAGEGKIISCGGGVIKTEETMRYLSENGIVIWIRRDLASLFASDNRPLSSDEEAVRRLYEERLPLYEKYSDMTVDNNGRLEDTVSAVLKAVGMEEYR